MAHVYELLHGKQHQVCKFEIDTVKSQINELLHVATTKGIQDLKDKLKEVVPTYEEPEHHKAG